MCVIVPSTKCPRQTRRRPHSISRVPLASTGPTLRARAHAHTREHAARRRFSHTALGRGLAAAGWCCFWWWWCWPIAAASSTRLGYWLCWGWDEGEEWLDCCCCWGVVQPPCWEVALPSRRERWPPSWLLPRPPAREPGSEPGMPGMPVTLPGAPPVGTTIARILRCADCGWREARLGFVMGMCFVVEAKACYNIYVRAVKKLRNAWGRRRGGVSERDKVLRGAGMRICVT